MQNPYLFTRPLSMGEILDRSFRLYRNKMGLLLMTAAILLVPLGVLNGVLTGATLLDQIGGWRGVFDLPIPPPQQTSPFAGVLSIIIGLATSVVTLGLTYQVIGLAHGNEHSARASLGKGVRRLLRYILMTILQGLLIGAIAVGAVLLFVFGGILFSDGILGVILGVIFALGIIAIILYFTGRWSIAVPAFIEQELGARRSLGVSWELTDGHVGRAILFMIILGLLNIVLLILPTVLLILVALLFTQVPEIVLTIVSTIETLIGVVWLPLQAAATVLFYYDCRVRKEGYDLEQRLQQVEAGLG